MKAYTSDGAVIEPGQTVYLSCGHPVKVRGIETRNGKTPEVILQLGDWGIDSNARPLGYWDDGEKIFSTAPA